VNDETIRELLATYARRAYDRRLVGGTGGNFSARLSNDKVAITPSGVALGDTTVENLVDVDIATCEWTARDDYIPSKEYLFHVEIMRLRPDVGAVLHVHPHYATAYAVRKRAIPMVTDAAFKQPPMPAVPFAPSGSTELRDNVAAAVRASPDCTVLLMEQHGIAALGATVVAAYNVADLTEDLAHIAFLANQLKRGENE
jgi:ribulose-5-phosphate 4-epimerase/fuculose-1-phosphate aldolase